MHPIILYDLVKQLKEQGQVKLNDLEAITKKARKTKYNRGEISADWGYFAEVA